MTTRSIVLTSGALALPPLVSGVIIAILTVFGDVAWINGLLGNVGLYIAWAWGVCGVPYAIAGLGFILWSVQRDEVMVRRRAWLLPVLWVGVSVAWALVQSPMPLRVAAIGAASILLIAYIYLALVLGISKSFQSPGRPTTLPN